MMRASLESLDEKYWSDEEAEPQGSSSSNAPPRPSSSSSSAAHPDDDDDPIDETSLSEHWADVAEALADPNCSYHATDAANWILKFFFFAP